MNGPEQKACYFGALMLGAYATHQATVGGDGVVFGAVLAALGAVGGYVVAAERLRKQV